MTMNKFDKYVDDVINGFQNNRGKASVYCLKPFNPIIVAYNVINRFHIKNPQDEIFIVVDSYNTRVTLLNYFTFSSFGLLIGLNCGLAGLKSSNFKSNLKPNTL